MDWLSLRQALCGGEVLLTSVPFGAEKWLHRNRNLSSDKRLKWFILKRRGGLNAASRSHWATESHRGRVTLDRMTGVELSHALTLHRGDTKEELSRPSCLDWFIPLIPPSASSSDRGDLLPSRCFLCLMSFLGFSFLFFFSLSPHGQPLYYPPPLWLRLFRVKSWRQLLIKSILGTRRSYCEVSVTVNILVCAKFQNK